MNEFNYMEVIDKKSIFYRQKHVMKEENGKYIAEICGSSVIFGANEVKEVV